MSPKLVHSMKFRNKNIKVNPCDSLLFNSDNNTGTNVDFILKTLVIACHVQSNLMLIFAQM